MVNIKNLMGIKADLSQKNDLLASGGSDYHSPSKINRELGLYGDIDNRKPHFGA